MLNTIASEILPIKKKKGVKLVVKDPAASEFKEH